MGKNEVGVCIRRGFLFFSCALHTQQNPEGRVERERENAIYNRYVEEKREREKKRKRKIHFMYASQAVKSTHHDIPSNVSPRLEKNIK